MKFSCHRCKTRYSIADEKVRGKILKVRCKKCSELIVVRERTLTSPNELERGGSGLINIGKRSRTRSSPPTPPPDSAEIDWFYAVDGRTEGPLLQSRLIDLLKNGRIPRGAHAWREGMGVWRPIVEVDVFAAHAPEAPTVPPPPPGSPALQAGAAPPRPPAPALAPAAPAAPPAFEGPVGGAPSPPAAGPGFAPQPINGRPAFEETGTSLPTLEDLADFDADAPGNLTGPRSVNLTMPPPAAPIGGGSGPHLAPSAHRFQSTSGSRDEARKRKLFIALPAIVALLVTIVVAVVVTSTPTADPEAAASVQAPVEEAVEAPVEVAAVEDVEFTFDAENLWDEPKPKKKKRRKPKGRVRPGGKAKGRRQSAGELDSAGIAAGPSNGGRRMIRMGPIGGMGDKTATDTSRLRKIGNASADALKPATLGPGEIKAVIKKHRRGLKQCLERHLKREGQDSVGNQKVIISWKISGSGRAQKIGLSGGMKESVFGRCVTGQIKNWRFPRHRGDPVDVKYPVILTSSP